FAEADFAGRKVTLVQPSDQVRWHGLDPARLDPASRSRIREELFTRHLELLTLDETAQDQLTCELREFVACMQSGRAPRGTGRDGLAALDVAERILKSIGTLETATPKGLLFPHQAEQDVA